MSFLLFSYIVLSSLLSISEERQNKDMKNLENLTDILNELHIQKLIKVESQDKVKEEVTVQNM
jgi:hypothetical protein